ncbi:hypothetical protein GCG54_00011104 [Colletotrichum gloeosporioides]|uniref:Uncharacterized protein n=1 Tax=Colletotrichum gloeosporioides TaxID=474922 RepID=A0A8H4CRW2_COLGL|nr:uncharacterized protein GCG54_00011104 [Colletotrichum gloeosporioides]KAF3808913.1 hypothetical protein GCG54_00011104 [Colletotrichum gloeosporioides]
MRFSAAICLFLASFALAQSSKHSTTHSAASKTASAAATTSHKTTSSRAAGPKETAAIALGALLGGVGVVANM